MVAKLIIFGWSLFCLWGLFTGVNELHTEMPNWEDSDAATVGVVIGLMIWLFAWAVVVVPTALVYSVFSKKETTQ